MMFGPDDTGKQTVAEAVGNYVDDPSMEQYMELRTEYGLDHDDILALQDRYEEVQEFEATRKEHEREKRRDRWKERAGYLEDGARSLADMLEDSAEAAGGLLGTGAISALDYGGQALRVGTTHAGNAAVDATSYVGDAAVEATDSVDACSAPDATDADLREAVAHARADFEAAMNDDLNTREAMAALLDLASAVNAHVDERDRYDFPGLKRAVDAFAELGGDVFGLSFGGSDGGEIRVAEDLVELVLDLRAQERDAGNYERADELRDRLDEIGVEVEDSDDGPTYRFE